MSATRRRLEDALQAGKNSSDESLTRNGSCRVNAVKDVDFGDIMGVFSVNISFNSQYVAAGCGNGAIQVYSCVTDKRRRPLKHGSLYGLPVTTVKFLPFKDDQLITTSSNGTVSLWDLDSWSVVKSVDELHNEISALDFSHDGKLFATAGKDRTVRVYDATNMELKLVFGGADSIDKAVSNENLVISTPEAGHGRKVFALKFHPFDDNVFLTAGWDRCVKIWDVRVDHVVRSIHGPYVCGDGIDICQDSIMTASWLARNALQIWDYGSGQLIEHIPFSPKEQSEYLYVGRFCSADVVAAGGSGTSDLRLIKRQTHEIVDIVEDEGKTIQSLDVGQDGQLLCFGSTGNHIKLVSLS